MANESLSQPALTFLSVLLAGSICINAWLMHTVRGINASTNERHHLSIGAEVPAVDVTDASGRRITIGFGPNSLPTIIYWFGPKCKWCKRNEIQVQHLARELSGRYRFISVANSSDGLTEYLESSHCSRPIYTDKNGNLRDAYGLGSTPQTLVLSPEGELLKSWTGSYESDTRADIESFFGIRLSDNENTPSQPLTCDTCAVAPAQQ